MKPRIAYHGDVHSGEIRKPPRPSTRNVMKIPRVNSVGILEFPGSYEATPRRLPAVLRLVAACVLIAFVAVGTVTTVVSFGAYCLTSHAGAPAPPEPSR